MDKRKVKDAKQDSKGNITHVLVEGNQRYTSVKRVISMAEKGAVDLVVVTPSNGEKHIRTRPDRVKKNNLDILASS
jgi:hypothetical protein